MISISLQCDNCTTYLLFCRKTAEFKITALLESSNWVERDSKQYCPKCSSNLGESTNPFINYSKTDVDYNNYSNESIF